MSSLPEELQMTQVCNLNLTICHQLEALSSFPPCKPYRAAENEFGLERKHFETLSKGEWTLLQTVGPQ